VFRGEHNARFADDPTQQKREGEKREKYKLSTSFPASAMTGTFFRHQKAKRKKKEGKKGKKRGLLMDSVHAQIFRGGSTQKKRRPKFQRLHLCPVIRKGRKGEKKGGEKGTAMRRATEELPLPEIRRNNNMQKEKIRFFVATTPIPLGRHPHKTIRGRKKKRGGRVSVTEGARRKGKKGGKASSSTWEDFKNEPQAGLAEIHQKRRKGKGKVPLGLKDTCP